MKRMVIMLMVVLLVGALFAMVYKFISQQAHEMKSKIVIVTKSSDRNLEFWQALAAGAKVAAKEFGVEIEIVGPRAESDVNGQMNILDNIVDYGPQPQVIILAPIDADKMTPIAEKIKKAGIELITIDSSVKGKLYPSVIATDNMAAGEKAAAEAVRLLPSSSRVAIININKGSTTFFERERGIRQKLAEYPDFQIKYTLFCDGEEEKAYEITKNLLSEGDSIEGIIALNETATQGAARAVKEIGLNRDVKLIGFDSSAQEINSLEEGYIQALVVQKPFNMGYLAVKSSVQLLNKSKIDSQIDTGSEIITQANMFTDENEKLLFTFGER
ncbi:substrate-binding domain-containing protein [Paenibacillus sp. Soil787]|uniref:substrate-binding domain-containing protein n=1 Tax=Paenibacillus sp. Soil787 TaxID=1736411 RepID=UPI0007008DB0|nr:substrate-binding domain-containing protein [Paenibacillus sp. Soil787]KRF42969.1 hypothetical protein ASG93_20670 [Paenibacillus sp. Soil787]